MKKHDPKNDKVTCKTPTPGKKPTNIERWKYDTVRAAILNIVSDHKDGVLFKDLPQLVGQRLPDNIKEKLGSVNWYTTTVKLDLEVREEIKRVAGSNPQRLIKA